MSTRERWIVYPLLFLALGTAIKPKLAPLELRGSELSSTNLTVNRVECRELYVVGPDERPCVAARAAPAGGEILVSDNRRNVVVAIRADPATRAGFVETRKENGRPQAVMMSSATGGELAAYDNVAGRSVAIGYRNGESGLIETNLQMD